MALESKVVFERRVQEVGISSETFEKMKTRGWTTLGAFSFCCPVSGNGANSEAFEKTAVELVGEDVTPPALPRTGDLPGLRRLFFEAWITSSAELKYRLERRDGDAPRRLPDAEKAQRKGALKALLGAGLKLQNELDPSDNLVDIAVAVYETEQVKRIPWEHCTSKLDEVECDRTVSALKVDKDGMVRMGTSEPDICADASTILKLGDALVRRGAALHIAGVISWETHQALAGEILAALKAEPPPGMSKISLSVAKAYDQEVWRRTAELAEGRVKAMPLGSPPLDAIMAKVMVEPRVAMLLLPRFTGGGGGSSSSGPDTARIQKLEAQLADLKRQRPQESGGGSNRGSGKGGGGGNKKHKSPANQKGGKDRGKGKGCRIPGLEGMETRHNGRPICFGFNLGQCKAGGDCNKGQHVCGGCFNASCAWTKPCPRK